MLGDPGNGRRSPVDQYDHERGAGGLERLDQLLLHARQPQLGAVARFARGAGRGQPRPVAHHDDRHFGAAHRRDGGAEVGFGWINDAAALGVANLDRRVEPFAQHLQDRLDGHKGVGQFHAVWSGHIKSVAARRRHFGQ